MTQIRLFTKMDEFVSIVKPKEGSAIFGIAVSFKSDFPAPVFAVTMDCCEATCSGDNTTLTCTKCDRVVTYNSKSPKTQTAGMWAESSKQVDFLEDWICFWLSMNRSEVSIIQLGDKYYSYS